MSTIAVSGDQMSCDGLVTGGYGRIKTTKVKIIRHNKELWGFVGNVHEDVVWKRWIDGGHKLGDMPKGTDAVRLGKEHITIYNKDEHFYERVTTRFTAIGSGMSFAIGALEQGASSAEAVSIASKYDERTGGAITTMNLGDENET